jgi:hypothetical protein
MNKKIFRVKLKYFQQLLAEPLPVPCIGEEYGAFFFNWSLETAKQFMKHLLSMQPTKFFISSTSEIESITNKTAVFQKILENYNRVGNKKIDKFELISIIPFIMESNFEIALTTSLSNFCLENENLDIITRAEVGLFIDSFFRSAHNILQFKNNKDEIYQKTKENILKLSESIIEEILMLIFKKEEEEMPIGDVIRKLPRELKTLMETINNGLFQSLKYFNEKHIKKENLMN